MERSREWVGIRAAVGLAFLVAVLSVTTGVVNIAARSVSGPFAGAVPAVVHETAGFTGTLTGFLMLVSAIGLRRGLRAAWYSTLLLLPITAAQGLLQVSEYSYPLVVVSLAALPVVLLNRRRFDRDLDLTGTQLAALVALVGAQAYGTVGTYALREGFDGVTTLTDAFWFTVVTGSTVGYGDVTPAPDDPGAKLFGISVLLVNVSSFAVALGVLLTPAIEARLSKALGKMTETDLELLENHILVLGHGELTEPIVEELGSRTRFLVVTPDAERARALTERGFDTLVANPSDEAPLRRARIDAARAAVVATNNDAEDALSILTARQLNDDLRIVAAATDRENVDKLRRAGADAVISPASIGGHLLVESALGDEGTEALAERILTDRSSDGDGDGDEEP
ncbi:NAD-binding protein [Halegenticoccus tardaugens]|uniref:NAD-binding protein n=1 Tax=Halegenticoccus tardaugens TaxID=2071624 RepID=UPI00100ADF67|nr:NAD-binding protein [Halegenticoccus tardaugens]